MPRTSFGPQQMMTYVRSGLASLVGKPLTLTYGVALMLPLRMRSVHIVIAAAAAVGLSAPGTPMDDGRCAR